MGKKILIIVLILIVIVIGAVEIGVSIKNNNDSTEIKAEENNKVSEEFLFTYNGMNIELGKEFSREKFGQEVSYSEIESCAFEGLDKTYTYEHYEITSYPQGDKENVLSIYFLDPEVSTTEGVSIGDSYDKMVEVYSDKFEKTDNKYVYTKGDTSLEFIVENGKITSIEYIYNV